MIVGVVISNLLYLIVALAVAALGALVVVLRHRKPKSVEANVASFHRGLRALAPDQPTASSDSGPSWGGASRRAATTPTAFRPLVTSAVGEAEDVPAESPGDDDDHHADPVETAEAASADGDGDGELDSADEAVVDHPSEGPAAGAVTEAETEVDDEDAPDLTPTSESSEPGTPAAVSAGTPPAVDPVHLTSRKRRSSSGSSSGTGDESEVPTEEAGTG